MKFIEATIGRQKRKSVGKWNRKFDKDAYKVDYSF